MLILIFHSLVFIQPDTHVSLTSKDLLDVLFIIQFYLNIQVYEVADIAFTIRIFMFRDHVANKLFEVPFSTAYHGPAK